MPIVALHGAYSTHNEIAAVLEPILGPIDAHRRIYPDLPGMGDSPAHDSVRSAADVVDLLDEFVRSEIGDVPFLLVGYSFGGHLAQGLAARRRSRVAGLALVCPLMPATMNAEAHVVVATNGNPADWLETELVAEYTGYFVIHSSITAKRFQDAVAPSIGRFDGDAVARVMADWALPSDPDTVQLDQPTLVVTGRHDSWVGYRDQMALLDRYPRATFVTVADAGHAVAHEHPRLIAALIGDWLDRCVPEPLTDIDPETISVDEAWSVLRDGPAEVDER